MGSICEIVIDSLVKKQKLPIKVMKSGEHLAKKGSSIKFYIFTLCSSWWRIHKNKLQKEIWIEKL